MSEERARSEQTRQDKASLPRVLVVDEGDDFRILLPRLLGSRLRVAVSTASDPRGTVELRFASPEPDAILLRCRSDGTAFAAAHAVKSIRVAERDHGLRRVAIAAYGTGSSGTHIERAVQAGADASFLLPVGAAQLAAVVAGLLAGNGAARGSEDREPSERAGPHGSEAAAAAPPSRCRPAPDDERATPNGMLTAALADLEAAEALERLVRVALSDHHQPVGALVEAVTVREAELRAEADAAGARHDPEWARVMDDYVLSAASGSAELLLQLRNLLGGWGRRSALGDLAAAERAVPWGQVSPGAAVLPISLSQADAASLLEALAAMTADDGTRAVRATRHGGMVLVQVLGTPSVPRGLGGRPLSADGLVGAAGGILNLMTRERVVAEAWLPLGEWQPRPTTPTEAVDSSSEQPHAALPAATGAAVVRLGWVQQSDAGKALAQVVGPRTGCEVQILPTNGHLLAADEVGPFDVVLLQAHDHLDAAEVAATLRGRAPRLGSR